MSSTPANYKESTKRRPASRKEAKQPRARPTHFLALPLHTFPELRDRVAAFQNTLFPPGPQINEGSGRKPPRISSIVQGLDSSIVIDPRRLHMTLGVVCLEPDVAQDQIASVESESAPNDVQPTAHTRRTPRTALALLTSLKPRISEILSGDEGVYVPLEVMDVLKPERMRPLLPSQDIAPGRVEEGHTTDNNAAVEKVGAGVLFIGPAQKPDSEDTKEREKLMDVCEFVHRAFREAGYITETRPLKLHCTILNASHRKPSRRMPFCYSDILASSACSKLLANDDHDKTAPMRRTSSDKFDINQSLASMKLSNHRPQIAVPEPLNVTLGTYNVHTIELWVLGSHGPNNEYVSCGGISLG